MGGLLLLRSIGSRSPLAIIAVGRCQEQTARGGFRMKLGIVGKGGVGKTTLSALFAQEYARRGLRVLAIDTDSNPNLAHSLGLNSEQADDIPLLPRSVVVGTGGDGSMTTAELISQYG